MRKYLFLVVFFAIAFNSQAYSQVNSNIAIVPHSYERDGADDSNGDGLFGDFSDSDLNSSLIEAKDGVSITNDETHVQKGTSVFVQQMFIDRGTLVVEGDLTLKNGLRMSQDGKLIIKQGATLNIEHSINWEGSIHNFGEINTIGHYDVFAKFSKQNVNEVGAVISVNGKFTIERATLLNKGKIYANGGFFTGSASDLVMGIGSVLKIMGDWKSETKNVVESPDGPSCIEYLGGSDITFFRQKEPLSSKNINLCVTSGSTITNYGVATYIANCTGCEEALPIGLKCFNLEHPQNISNVILFKWATETETNNDFFTIQSSYDGVNFCDEEVIPGAGNSSQTKEYERTITFSEDTPIYFRLKQTDYDGTVSYSHVIVDKESFETNFFSAKSIGKERIDVNLNLQSPSPVVVKILTPQGSVLKTLKYSLLDSGAHSILLEGINPGVYFVQLKLANQMFTQKVVLN